MATAAPLQPPIPGPAPLPVMGARGNLLRFLGDPISYMERVYRRYGALASMTEGELSQVLAFGPEYNRLLLGDAARFYSIFETITSPQVKARRRGMGLLNMNGEQHKQQRRLMMPAFHRKQVEGYRDDMVAFTRQALDGWRPGHTLDVAREIGHLTLRIACRTLFGLDVSDGAPELRRLVNRLFATNQFAPQNMLLQVDLPGTPFHRMLRNAARLEDAILELIARKRAQPAGQHDVLALLIHARDEDGTQMSDYELIGHTRTLLLAGHETTANTLLWTLLLLAQHPDILADVVDELDGELGGDAPAVAQLGRLPLLDCVIKESMRLLPPAAVMSRVGVQTFEIGPYILPPGSIVTLSPYITHRLTELYADPRVFKPRRWETLDLSPYEYIPFGAGPRLCIGMSFALMEIKLVLAMLLQRFRLSVPPGTRVNYQLKITLSPRGGLPMLVLPQDRRFEPSVLRGTIRRLVDLPYS